MQTPQGDELIDFIDALYGPSATSTEGILHTVAEKAPSPSLLDLLSSSLTACTNMADLFKLASSDGFKEDAASLSPADVVTLRGVYNARKELLDNQVQIATLDGVIINIVGVDWWNSDYGAGVTFTFHPESDPGKTLRTRTSARSIVRFSTRWRENPTEQNPVRAVFELVPVSDPERAKLGQKVWNAHRLPPVTRSSDGGVPF